jgi:hypothetical protein
VFDLCNLCEMLMCNYVILICVIYAMDYRRVETTDASVIRKTVQTRDPERASVA